MMELIRVVSDIHYASDAEKARGNFRSEAIRNPFLRMVERSYSHWIWRRDPFGYNHLVADFCDRARDSSLVVANGDFSCDSAYIGIADDASFQSARECLEHLKQSFGSRLFSTVGDHELGKNSFLGGLGGIRLKSFHRLAELGIPPFWLHERGRFVLVGMTSSLAAYPLFCPEGLVEEKKDWEELRQIHLQQLDAAFGQLSPSQRVLLFCHDPSALPYLRELPQVEKRLDQIEMTVIGHLHSELVWYKSKVLAGIPAITFMGSTARRLSSALRKAKLWKPFKVKLCPALGGIELLKDGGFAEIELPQKGPALFRRVNL